MIIKKLKRTLKGKIILSLCLLAFLHCPTFHFSSSTKLDYKINSAQGEEDYLEPWSGNITLHPSYFFLEWNGYYPAYWIVTRSYLSPDTFEDHKDFIYFTSNNYANVQYTALPDLGDSYRWDIFVYFQKSENFGTNIWTSSFVWKKIINSSLPIEFRHEYFGDPLFDPGEDLSNETLDNPSSDPETPKNTFDSSTFVLLLISVLGFIFLSSAYRVISSNSPLRGFRTYCKENKINTVKRGHIKKYIEEKCHHLKKAERKALKNRLYSLNNIV
ncbi:MAG: hypothetical protein ACTSYI_02830 [Promethearchaeota archaeon]